MFDGCPFPLETNTDDENDPHHVKDHQASRSIMLRGFYPVHSVSEPERFVVESLDRRV